MRIFFLFALFIFHQKSLAQQYKPETGESGRKNVNQLSSSIFKYPEFTEGKILRKDGSAIEGKLNYNRILGKILFVDRLGKPTALESPETIDKVVIANDTFYIYNDKILEKVTHFLKVNLYIKETIVYIEKDKTNNGESPVIITTDGKLPYSIDNEKQDKGINKSSLFKFITEYYLDDKSGNFYVASKKIFYKLFPDSKNELKSYLHDHSVNFNNREEMKNLLLYLQSL